MQIAGSQIGMSWAMLRFSYCVVPVGKVPLSGKALTGRLSPRLAIITPSTSLTNFGAEAGTGGTIFTFEVACCGYFTSCRLANAASTAAKFCWMTFSPPFLPYVFLMASLIRAIASLAGITPASLKKQVCMIVLIRTPISASRATW